MVKENKCILNKPSKDGVIIAKNYLEAVGIIKTLEEGLSLESVTRPIYETKVIK